MIDLVLFDDLGQLKKYGERLGVGSYIIARDFGSEKEILALKEKIKNEKLDFRVCKIVGTNDNKEVGSFRGKADFIAVDGKDAKMNNFSVSTKGVDFLLQPISSGKLEFDIATARVAADRNVPVAFLFSDYLNASSLQRSLLLKNSFIAVKLMKRFGGNALFFSGARNAQELRATADLASFAAMLGFSPEQGKRFVGKFAEEVLEK